MRQSTIQGILPCRCPCRTWITQSSPTKKRVHDLLSERLEDISRLFGQLPDTLEDVWVQVALGQVEEAKRTIDRVPRQHPFELRYHEVQPIDWESCARVLDNDVKRRALAQGWGRCQSSLQ